MELVVLLVLSYLLGSIPFGLLIARSRGHDIRKAGSGNIGATNVMRVVGKGWGIATLILDALKGVGAVYLASFSGAEAPEWLGLACGCSAIAGHSFPVYLKFKGGKGVATSAGVLLAVAPEAFAVGIGVFAILFAIFRYVSLGSIVAAVAVPLASYFFTLRAESPNHLNTYVLAGLGAVVIWRHKANIRRLLNGTENRIAGKQSKTAHAPASPGGKG